MPMVNTRPWIKSLLSTETSRALISRKIGPIYKYLENNIMGLGAITITQLAKLISKYNILTMEFQNVNLFSKDLSLKHGCISPHRNIPNVACGCLCNTKVLTNNLVDFCKSFPLRLDKCEFGDIHTPRLTGFSRRCYVNETNVATPMSYVTAFCVILFQIG